ncbi:PREDICTED: SLAM family member 9-like [Acanthisitta chloris]|uniref:SLAM family member 9-like n=1 Tax=Acanthisitta chloris TaxID=57068 RepID=UPI0004F0FE83|nr:PREDICTED: SLAM family member 9-like [Acanthisitta chloris]
MDVFWFLLLTLLFLLRLQDAHANEVIVVTRAVGSSVTFYPRIPHKDGGVWSFNNDPIISVSYGDPPSITFLDAKYRARFTFRENGTALTISQLCLEDTGTYSEKASGVRATFILQVYRELPEPAVSCEVQNCSGSRCHYALHCATPGSGFGNVSYTWSVGHQLWQEGPEVLLDEFPSDEPPQPLTCRAENPVSSRNVTLASPAELCAGSQSSSWVGITAAALVGAAVLSVVLFYIIYCKCKEAGAEDMTVYAKVGPYQQINTTNNVPKTVPTKGVETSKTIYFTVQAVAQTDDEKMGNVMLEGQEQKSIYSSIN